MLVATITTPSPPNPMEQARKLADEVRAGRLTADKAGRILLGSLSYYKGNRIPKYSARFISACSDLIYSAEVKGRFYRDSAEEEANRMLRDAAAEVKGK